MLSRFTSLRRALVTAVGAAILLLSPMHSAQAYGFVRFGFGFPVVAPYYPFYGPRVVYAPAPVIYAPPPVVYTQPSPYGAGSSGRCYAGAYVCPLSRALTVGTPCSCPTNTARIAGQVG